MTDRVREIMLPDGFKKPNKDDTIIAVMGMTGVGKSSFISLCMDGNDERPKVGTELHSCTQLTQTYKFQYPGPPKRRIILVDTPGFDDSTRNDTEVLRDIISWLTTTYAQGIHLAGLIYMHKINDTRMSGSAIRNVGMFKKLCGDHALANVILVTSMWDLVSPDVGAAREAELKKVREYWGYMTSRGSRVCRYENTRESALRIIGQFVDRTGTDDPNASQLTLVVQDEMVRQKKSLYETAVAAVVSANIRRKRDDVRETMEARRAAIQEKYEEAKRNKDQAALKGFDEDAKLYEATMKDLQEDEDGLRVSLKQLNKERRKKIAKMVGFGMGSAMSISMAIMIMLLVAV